MRNVLTPIENHIYITSLSLSLPPILFVDQRMENEIHRDRLVWDVRNPGATLRGHKCCYNKLKLDFRTLAVPNGRHIEPTSVKLVIIYSAYRPLTAICVRCSVFSCQLTLNIIIKSSSATNKIVEFDMIPINMRSKNVQCIAKKSLYSVGFRPAVCFFENDIDQTINGAHYMSMISNFHLPDLDDMDTKDMWFHIKINNFECALVNSSAT